VGSALDIKIFGVQRATHFESASRKNQRAKGNLEIWLIKTFGKKEKYHD